MFHQQCFCEKQAEHSFTNIVFVTVCGDLVASPVLLAQMMFVPLRRDSSTICGHVDSPPSPQKITLQKSADLP